MVSKCFQDFLGEILLNTMCFQDIKRMNMSWYDYEKVLSDEGDVSNVV